jgi:uncharacterized protein YgiM (DUF1202 family)
LREKDLIYVQEQSVGWIRIGDDRWVSASHITVTHTAQSGMVTDAHGANVRKGPGSHFPVVDVRPNGSLVQLISRDGTWWEIEPDQWMHTSVVVPLVWREGTVVGTATLNVRIGPGTQHRIVRRLRRGDRIWVRETQGAWHRIANSEWVYAAFIDLGG